MKNKHEKTKVEMNFQSVFDRFSWGQVKNEIYSCDEKDVLRALRAPKRNLEHFKALLSPAAVPCLEQMAGLSRQLTLRRFGNVIQLYAPLYVSNECQNICTYCGFSLDNPLKRKTLTDAELLAEAAFVRKAGFQSVLLVSGEAGKTVGVNYFENALRLLVPVFSQVSMEVQPLEQHEYERLAAAGLNGVLVYQETYHRETYKIHHPKGKKSNFYYRLDTPDRLGRAGIHKIGLGALLGLEDWRTDSFFTALHLDYLEKTYWKTRYSISFPRLRPCAGGLPPKAPMGDRELLQLICAYRLLNEDVELSLSTRESERFRNNVIRLGINSISAGSKTNPGGYNVEPQSLEQFETDDGRPAHAVAAMIAAQGYEPVWKDWDRSLVPRHGTGDNKPIVL